MLPSAGTPREAEVRTHEDMMTAGLSAQDKARLLALLARIGGNPRTAQRGMV